MSRELFRMFNKILSVIRNQEKSTLHSKGNLLSIIFYLIDFSSEKDKYVSSFLLLYYYNNHPFVYNVYNVLHVREETIL